MQTVELGEICFLTEVEGLIPAVRTIAKRFTKRFRYHDYDDMVSVGMLSVWKSRTKYKPEKGSFRSFAVNRAFEGMVEFSDLDNAVHVARSIQWQHKTGRYTEHSFISESIARAKRKPESIHDVKENRHGPHEALEQHEILELIDAAILLLDERQQFIIDLRYSQGKSMAQVAAQLGLTRQRVYQLESESLLVIRRELW